MAEVTKKYLDQAGLKLLLGKLNDKYDARYLGINAEAKSAAKVKNALSFTIGDADYTFDGSAAVSATAAAAKVHQHKAADVTDFVGEVRKVVFGSEGETGIVGAHDHGNLEALNQISGEKIAAWDAKIAVGDLARLTYANEKLSGATNAKLAIDALVDSTLALANEVAGKESAGAAEQALKDAKAYADAEDKKIEDLIGSIEEGKTVAGLISEAASAASVADGKAVAAQADVDALEKRLDDEGGLVDRLESVEAKFEGDQSVDSKIAAAEAAAKKYADDEDAKIEARVKAIEDLGDLATDAEVSAIQQALQANIDKKVDKTAYDAKVENFEGRIAANEAFVAAQPAIDAEQNRRLGVVEGAIEVLNGEGDGSVKKQIATAISEVNGAAETLAGRVAANEAAIEVINGTGEGSIKKAVADLVNGAPEALNTLDELAEALRDNADVLDAIEEAFDGKLAALQKDVDQNEADCDAAIKAEQEARAALKTELQGEIDADVKVVADALANEKDASKEGSLAKKIADEVARADAEEKAIREAFAAEDTKLANRISTLETSVKDGGTIFEAIEAAQAAADAAQGTANQAVLGAEAAAKAAEAVDKKVGTVADGKTVVQMISEAQAAAEGKAATAQQAAEAAQKDVDDLEALVGSADSAAKGTVFGAIADVQADVNAKDQAMDARVDAVEAAKHSHDNKAELDKIADGDVAKWNSAEANAKAYTDAEIAKFGALDETDINAAFAEIFGA